MALIRAERVRFSGQSLPCRKPKMSQAKVFWRLRLSPGKSRRSKGTPDLLGW